MPKKTPPSRRMNKKCVAPTRRMNKTKTAPSRRMNNNMVGGSFWKDFAKGFSSVFEVAGTPLGLIGDVVGHPELNLISPIGKAVKKLGKGKPLTKTRVKKRRVKRKK
mgnify:CR=1 FL=1